jgi:hypothetical protein
MNISENIGSSWSTRTIVALSSRMMTHSVIAATEAKRRGWPLRQPSPKKVPFPWIATTASFPRSETTVTLTLVSVLKLIESLESVVVQGRRS